MAARAKRQKEAESSTAVLLRELEGALNELERERGIPRDVLREAITQAILTAYKRHFAGADQANVTIDIGPAGVRVFRRLKVVDDTEYERMRAAADADSEQNRGPGEAEPGETTGEEAIGPEGSEESEEAEKAGKGAGLNGEAGEETTGQEDKGRVLSAAEADGTVAPSGGGRRPLRVNRDVIPLSEARRIRPDYQVGEVVQVEVTPREFGRIAAQAAKQVLVQRLREAERALVYQQFANKEGDIVTGVVQRRENRNLVIDLGKVEALMPPSEQVPTENYQPGTRLKVYVAEVRKAARGPQVVVSRTHPGLLKRLFELEVPEIHDGIVEIKAVAREPGHRAKIAVHSRKPGVDPVGACVGPRGMRVQNVVQELRGEKVDIIPWDPLPEKFIARALEPAEAQRVILRPLDKSARVIVPDNKLSLAIGREGQNARLAAKLTGWKIDIKSTSQMAEILAQELFTPAVKAGREKEEVVAPGRTPEGVAAAPVAAAPEPAPEAAPLPPDWVAAGAPAVEAGPGAPSAWTDQVPVPGEEGEESREVRPEAEPLVGEAAGRRRDEEESERPARRTRGPRREKRDEIELDVLEEVDEPLPTLFSEESEENKTTTEPRIRKRAPVRVRSAPDQPLATSLAALLQEKGVSLPGLTATVGEGQTEGKKEAGASSTGSSGETGEPGRKARQNKGETR